MKIKKLILFLMLLTLCVNLASCASSAPIVVVKGIDFDDGTSNTEPKDKSTWMWITYATAKRQLTWINHHK